MSDTASTPKATAPWSGTDSIGHAVWQRVMRPGILQPPASMTRAGSVPAIHDRHAAFLHSLAIPSLGLPSRCVDDVRVFRFALPAWRGSVWPRGPMDPGISPSAWSSDTDMPGIPMPASNPVLPPVAVAMSAIARSNIATPPSGTAMLDSVVDGAAGWTVSDDDASPSPALRRADRIGTSAYAALPLASPAMGIGLRFGVSGHPSVHLGIGAASLPSPPIVSSPHDPLPGPWIAQRATAPGVAVDVDRTSARPSRSLWDAASRFPGPATAPPPAPLMPAAMHRVALQPQRDAWLPAQRLMPASAIAASTQASRMMSLSPIDQAGGIAGPSGAAHPGWYAGEEPVTTSIPASIVSAVATNIAAAAPGVMPHGPAVIGPGRPIASPSRFRMAFLQASARFATVPAGMLRRMESSLPRSAPLSRPVSTLGDSIQPRMSAPSQITLPAFPAGSLQYAMASVLPEAGVLGLLRSAPLFRPVAALGNSPSTSIATPRRPAAAVFQAITLQYQQHAPESAPAAQLAAMPEVLRQTDANLLRLAPLSPPAASLDDPASPQRAVVPFRADGPQHRPHAPASLPLATPRLMPTLSAISPEPTWRADTKRPTADPQWSARAADLPDLALRHLPGPIDKAARTTSPPAGAADGMHLPIAPVRLQSIPNLLPLHSNIVLAAMSGARPIVLPVRAASAAHQSAHVGETPKQFAVASVRPLNLTSSGGTIVRTASMHTAISGTAGFQSGEFRFLYGATRRANAVHPLPGQRTMGSDMQLQPPGASGPPAPGVSIAAGVTTTPLGHDARTTRWSRDELPLTMLLRRTGASSASSFAAAPEHSPRVVAPVTIARPSFSEPILAEQSAPISAAGPGSAVDTGTPIQFSPQAPRQEPEADLDDIVERVWSALLLRLAIEHERRGFDRWS